VEARAPRGGTALVVSPQSGGPGVPGGSHVQLPNWPPAGAGFSARSARAASSDRVSATLASDPGPPPGGRVDLVSRKVFIPASTLAAVPVLV